MTILAISTSQPLAGVAVAAGDAFRWCEVPAANTGEHLRTAVADVLRGDTVSLVVVETGPGSYTGGRIGVAFGQGFARAKAVAWVGITVWNILSELAPNGYLPVTAVRSGEVLVQLISGEVRNLPMRDCPAPPFGFPLLNPAKYGGDKTMQGSAPELAEWLRTLCRLAAGGAGSSQLPKYHDRFSVRVEPQ